MKRQTLLVVEDDPKVRRLLRNVLEGEGFAVLESDDGETVLKLVDSRPIDLVTLDIHLGSRNGLELARDIRRVSNVPIIMITGQDDVLDRVVGLEVGADDYVTKPFHVREVIARVRSVLRRAGQRDAGATEALRRSGAEAEGESGKAYCFDGFTAIPDRLVLVDRSGKDCMLTSGDFKLLTVFLNRPKHVLSRDQLMDLTGGTEWSPLDRTIDNQVARLRKKIEHDSSDPKLIKTVRGVGYTLACEVRVVQSSEVSDRSA